MENKVRSNFTSKEIDLFNKGYQSAWEGFSILGNKSFKDTHLKYINIPDTIKAIYPQCFSESSCLETCIINTPIDILEKYTFERCRALKNIVLPDSIVKIDKYCFFFCSSLKDFKFPNNLMRIDEMAFSHCESLENLEFPKNLQHISALAFSDCKNLKKVIFNSVPAFLSLQTFNGCDNINEVGLIVDNELKLIQLNNAFSNMTAENYTISEKIYMLLRGYDKDIDRKLNKIKFKFPMSILENYISRGNFDSFKSNFCGDYFSFVSEPLNEVLSKTSAVVNNETISGIIKFATSIGCFSSLPIENPRTHKKVPMGQIACGVFNKLLTDGQFDYFDFSILDDLPYNIKPNIDLLSYLMITETKGNIKAYPLINLLYESQNKDENNFVRIIKEFDTIVKYKNDKINANNKPIDVITNKIRMYLDDIIFANVDEDNADIAEEFKRFREFKQIHFDNASNIKKYAKMVKIPHHIVGKELKEPIINDVIEEINNSVIKSVDKTISLLNELDEKLFTYEWLDKLSAHNFSLGLDCDSCGNITSSFYGKVIAESCFYEKNIQSLIIRDKKGNIISKGTIYVNENLGLAVFNDFELNNLYKHSEKENKAGYYSVAPNSKEELDRKKILNAYIRGIEAFVKEYDKLHPEKPLLKINVGTGHNRLNSQLSKYKLVKENDLINVPQEYSFQDSSDFQRILYERKEQTISSNNEK